MKVTKRRVKSVPDILKTRGTIYNESYVEHQKNCENMWFTTNTKKNLQQTYPKLWTSSSCWRRGRI